MVYINGIHPSDALRAARAIVNAVGVGGVCQKDDHEPKCAKMAGGHDCVECAVKTRIIFIHDERKVGGNEKE